MGAVLDPSEEVVVYTDSVIHPVLTGKKSFLGRVNQGRDRRHYDVSHSGGEDAVVGVGNADGPSVRNKPRVLLGNEEKKPVIEPRGGMVTPAKLGEDVEEEGSGKVGGSQAAKGIPSGPGVELLVLLIDSITDSRVGSKSSSWLTRFV